MPVLRLLLILSVLAMVACYLVFLLTKDVRFLKYAWRTVNFLITALIVLAVLYLLERYALVGWRILV